MKLSEALAVINIQPNRTLTSGDRLILLKLMELNEYKASVQMTTRDLAPLVSVSYRSAQRSMVRLEELGLVKIERTKGLNGMNGPNIYKVIY